MAAETVSCPQCDKKLRVPEELIGKLVKCPTCGHTFTAEISAAAKKNELEQKPDRSARVKTKDDEDDPPRKSQRSRDDDDDDRPIRKSRRSRNDDDDDDRPSRRRSRRGRWDDDDDDDDSSSRLRRRDLMPHRGPLILVLGILGLVIGLSTGVGLILGLVAWILGNSDLREMQAGRMDREGEGMTQGGRICGMIATILAIVSIGVGLFIMLLYFGCCCAAMGAGGGGANGF
jgi:predicted Zn finger-like uncharacterized protein